MTRPKIFISHAGDVAAHVEALQKRWDPPIFDFVTEAVHADAVVDLRGQPIERAVDCVIEALARLGISLKVRPRNTIDVGWREYQQLAATSRALKGRYDAARTWGLGFAVIGATLGAVAALQLAQSVTSTALALASAVLIGLGGYLGKEFLAPAQEAAWVLCRLRAEALKREVWKAALLIPPYDSPDASSSLQRQIGLLAKPSPTDLAPTRNDPPPDPQGIEDYVEDRVKDQIGYYVKRATELSKRLARLRGLVAFFGALSVLFGVFTTFVLELAAFIPVLAAASAAMIAQIRSERLEALIPTYRETALELSGLVAAWSDNALKHNKDGEHSLIIACEEAMARENGSWRAEYLDEQHVKDAMLAIEEAQSKAALAAAGPPKAIAPATTPSQ